MAQYLDLTGLSTLISKIKSNFTSQTTFNAHVTAQQAIDAAQDERIEALENASIKALTLNGTSYDGSVAVTADYGVTYDSTGKKIYLTLNGSNIGTGIDASDFIVDGMLQDVDLIVIPDDETVEGLAAGRYLKFTFNTDAGADPIYVNVTDLVDIYTLTAGSVAGTLVKITPTVTQGATKNDWVVSVTVDETALNTALAAKADKTYVDEQIAAIDITAIPTATVESTFDTIMAGTGA